MSTPSPSDRAGGPTAGDTVLRIRDLRITYRNGFAALTGVDLDIAQGECVALVGESGCGKTSLARAILGLLPAHTSVTGEIALAGRELLSLRSRELRGVLGTQLGYVAQDPYAACDPLRTVGHHVAEAWLAKGGRPPEGEVTNKLDELGIHNAAGRLRDRPFQWSGGMLQRATIAAATAHAPLLTVADEPTSALDADLADGVLTALRAASPTLLLISHDPRLVAAHSDRIAVIDHGRIVEFGPTEQVLADPHHPYTRSLLAASTAVRRPPDRTRDTAARAILTATSLNRTYRTGRAEVAAVADVSLSIEAGELVGLYGPSGSGKSTLLRLLAGTEAPDCGAVRYTDARLAAPPPGYVMPIFQDPVASLDRRWPIWRTITEPLTRGPRLPRRERIERARAALAQVKLDRLDPTLLPDQLSVGQCQRVAIARALIGQPALIVADEPTASLDVTTAAEIVELLRTIASRGTAILIVSHDRPLLTALTDRAIQLDHGRVVVPVGAGAAGIR